MPIATGVFKKLAFKKQTALNVKAPAGGAGTARYLRRVTSTLDLAKATYQSAEILDSQQRRDFRHGVRSVGGSISGELSVGGYQQFMESVLRRVATAGVNSGALTNVTAAVTTGSQGTFGRAAGSFLTDGFTVGDVVNWTGWTAPATANNAHNFMIIALTPTVMTVTSFDGLPIVAKAAGDSVTCTVVGRKTFVPTTGHTRDYYTIEHFFADVAQSEQFVDCVIGGANISLPPTGMATVEFPVMGLDMQPGTVEYFTAPAAAASGGILAAVNGVLAISGTVVGIVTGLTISINGNYTKPGGVVGANIDPDIFPGILEVSGQVTIMFENATYRNLFVNETEASLSVALTANSLPNSPFTAFNMPRVKFGGAGKDDGTAGLTLTMPFTALENTTAGAGSLPTTIAIQDSAFV